VKGHAILERALLVGTRSADHIRASGHCGCIAMEVSPPFENRPYTWLHPNASQIRQIPPCTAGAVHTWPFATHIAYTILVAIGAIADTPSALFK
jgi:hypothetical protein